METGGGGGGGTEGKGRRTDSDGGGRPAAEIGRCTGYPSDEDVFRSPPAGFVWEAVRRSVAKCTDSATVTTEEVGEKGDERRLRPQRRIVVRNDFPYYFEDGIEHWCLWKLGCTDDANYDDNDGGPEDQGEVTEKDIEWAQRQLVLDGNSSLNSAVRNRGVIVDTLYWVNPPHLKSVPGIDHAHILCLRKG